jgi:hypothetical protein
MIRGNARFDGVAVLEGSFSFLGASNGLEGKAAFVNSKTGDTHGWTTNKQWSPQVLEKLKELRALMEVDLGQLHLEGGGEVLVAPTGAGTVLSESRGTGGLGEHLERVPSV